MAMNGTPIFPTGPLSENKVAQAFATTEALQQQPTVNLTGGDGEHTFADMTGKIRLVALWAERFWPCLYELNEMAALQSTFADQGFEFMAVLTESQGRLDYATARGLMDNVGGAGIPLWIEPAGGSQVAQAMATMAAPMAYAIPGSDPNRLTQILPCTLLIDTDGRVCGRMLGGKGIMRKQATHANWQIPLVVDEKLTGPQPTIRRNPTIWSHSDADRFITALKAGALAEIARST